jgi:hypothetical protein
MPTANITATTDWTKIADAADEFVLISTTSAAFIEYATTDSGAPSLERGHTLTDGDSLTRAAIGSGHIYARVRDERFDEAILAVTK